MTLFILASLNTPRQGHSPCASNTKSAKYHMHCTTKIPIKKKRSLEQLRSCHFLKDYSPIIIPTPSIPSPNLLLTKYTQTQKKLTTCLKCNKIVTVQNKTNQQLLIETLAFYWWHVKFLINHLISTCQVFDHDSRGCKVSPLSIACVATIVLDTGSASSAILAFTICWKPSWIN